MSQGYVGTFSGVQASDTMRVREQVKISTQRGVQSMTHLGVDPEQWQWRELRDYVVSSLNKRTGNTPRKDPAIEASIFRGFINRHGSTRAAMVAVYVLEVCEGRWGDKPITMNAFCKGSDAWFADRVLERIGEQ